MQLLARGKRRGIRRGVTALPKRWGMYPFRKM